MRPEPLVTLCATLSILTACAGGTDDRGGSFGNTFDDGAVTGIDDTSDSAEAGDGNDEGAEGDSTTSGDGDGDATSAGDDSTTSGDGDGDSTTSGDGDGDSTTTTGGDVTPDDMIDDFEDGDGALFPTGGRQGYWYTFNDETPTGTQTPPTDEVLPESGGANGTSMAMHTTGDGFTEWGAGVGVDLNNTGGATGVKMTWDASGYEGIVLMAKGSGQLRATVQIEATIPTAEGGTCSADCDPHGKALVLSNDWQQFTMPFAELAQEGWGTQADWDASKVVGIQFKVGPNQTFDFWIDEIGFY